MTPTEKLPHQKAQEIFIKKQNKEHQEAFKRTECRGKKKNDERWKQSVAR
jgi:hypothetical protein